MVHYQGVCRRSTRVRHSNLLDRGLDTDGAWTDRTVKLTTTTILASATRILRIPGGAMTLASTRMFMITHPALLNTKGSDRFPIWLPELLLLRRNRHPDSLQSWATFYYATFRIACIWRLLLVLLFCCFSIALGFAYFDIYLDSIKFGLHVDPNLSLLSILT